MNIGDHGDTAPPPRSAPGSRAMAAGLTAILISVGVGINFAGGRIALLLSLTGVLAGVGLVTLGVSLTDDPVRPMSLSLVAFHAAPGLSALMRRRNLALAGLVMASCAITAVSGEPDLVLCFAMLPLFLLGVSLINNGALGE